MSLDFRDITIGQSIRHYRVEVELGKGGMGKVFRAWDDHLDRQVAVKILAIHAFLDSDRKERFVREARIASALNHPNIVHVYDVDQTADGIDYIVMEYVKGKSLAALISGRGLPLTLCVKYASQVAGALAAAHQKGIIHRDIKPANIMIAEDGTAKVLDFGLSILTEPEGAMDPEKTVLHPSSGVGAAGRNAGSTLEWAVVGTVPYMSPEQTRGEPCDARSDIFSFGSLLYEMVTGDRAFVGDAAATLMSAILRDQPKPARENAKEVPPQLEQVIQRCLQKQADRRFQCMHDVKVALQEISETAAVSEIPAKGGERRHRAAAAGVAALLILGVGAGLGRMLKPSPPAPPTPPQVVLLSRDADYAGFSPDGKWLVYAAYRSGNMELFKRRADGGDETRLTATSANETQPAWSRDGWIAFVSDRDGGGIWEISADQPGSQPVRLTRSGKNPQWAPDGSSLAYEEEGAVYVLAKGQASPQRVVPPTGGSPQMAWSPDGKQLILWNYSQYDLCLVASAGGGCRPLGLVPLGEEVSGLTWSKDGQWLILSRGPFSGTKALWAIPFNLSSGKPAGNAIRLTVSSTDDIHCTLSPDGRTLAYTARDVDQDLYSFPVNPNAGQLAAEAKLIPITVSRRNFYPAVSRSGDVLVWTAQTGNEGLLYMKHPGQDDERHLTDFTRPSMREVNAALSPDASRVIYSSTVGGSYALWVKQSLNERPVSLPMPSSRLDAQPTWSPDGKTLAFYSTRSGNPDIWFVDVSGSNVRQITNWDSNESWPAFSPDGRRLAFVSDHNGNPDIWVRDNTSGRIEPYIEGPAAEGFGTWSPDGRYFYFSSDRSGEFEIWARNEQTGEIRQVTNLKSPSFGLPQSGLYTKFAVADSQLILPLQTRKMDVAILQNWQGMP